jgi:hypothetical protein
MNSKIKAFAVSTISSALVLSGFSTSPASAAPGDQAVITVSKSTGLNPDGETITITGTGFVPNANLTNATRPPLAPNFGGVYVSFGKFQDVWRPSAGAPSANRLLTFADSTRTKWLVPAANVAQIGGEAAGGVALAPDGTFTVTLIVSKTLNASGALVFNESSLGNYGIYTQTGGGARYAPFETYTPLTFLAPVVAPQTPAASAPSTKAPALLARVSNRVQFNSGSARATKSTKRELQRRVNDYKIASQVVITATAGSTVGASDKVVKSLAKKRANAIKKYLVAQGVPAEKIVIKAKIAKPGKKPSTRVVATP